MIHGLCQPIANDNDNFSGKTRRDLVAIPSRQPAMLLP